MAYKFPSMYKAKDAKSNSRTFQLIAYPESMPAPIEEVLSSFNLDKAAYILHDSDYNSEGDLKKAHYHIYIKNKSCVRVQTVADRFGVKVEQIPAFKNIDTVGMVDYWLHENDETKTLYSHDAVHTVNCTFDDLVKGRKEKENEGVKVQKIFSIIDDMTAHGDFDLMNLCKRCLEAGCWDSYRRAQTTFIKILSDRGTAYTSSGSSWKDKQALDLEVSSCD